MIRIRTARRGAVLASLTMLLSGTAAAFGATAAQADSACIGITRNSTASQSSFDTVRRSGINNYNLHPGNSDYGIESNPVTQFRIHQGDVATIEYTDIRTGRYLATHTNVVGGLYNKHECHIGVITVRPIV